MVLKTKQGDQKMIRGLLKPRSQVKAPPTKIFKDLKKEISKVKCRIKKTIDELENDNS